MENPLSLDKWTRCPRCGDDGELVYGLTGYTGSIKFKCNSRDHRLNRRFYSRYTRQNRVEFETLRKQKHSLLSKIFNPYPMENALDETLLDCFCCPSCGSDTVSGSVEYLETQLSVTKTAKGMCTTVWCAECTEYDRHLFLHNHHYPNEDMVESILQNSEYPPDYIERTAD